jgi:hypothetical membrane protein
MMEMKPKTFSFKQITGEVKVRTLEYKQKLLEFFGKFNIHSLLAIAGIVGPLMLTVGDLVAALSDPQYSLVKNSISSLALTGIGWLQTIGFLALGLLVEIFTTGFMFNVKRHKWFLLGIAIFVFFGFSMLLIGAFHTDPVGIARTTEGRIHGYIATASFTLFPVAMLCFLPSLKRDSKWKDLYPYTRITFFLGIALLVLTRIFQEKSGWFGLAERLLVANMILWVEVSAVRLFFLSLKRPQAPKTVSTPTIGEPAEVEADSQIEF